MIRLAATAGAQFKDGIRITDDETPTTDEKVEKVAA